MRRSFVWIVVGIIVASLVGGGIAWATTAPTQVVYFEVEDFSLSPDQKAELDELVPALEQATAVRIDGFVQRSREADREKGPARLSEKRANAVENYLQSQVKERSPNKQDIEWTTVGRGQPPFDVGFPWARRVEITIE